MPIFNSAYFTAWYAKLRIGILLKVCRFLIRILNSAYFTECRFVIRHITQTDTETETEANFTHTHTPTHRWGSLHSLQIFKQNQIILICSKLIAFLVIWAQRILFK